MNELSGQSENLRKAHSSVEAFVSFSTLEISLGCVRFIRGSMHLICPTRVAKRVKNTKLHRFPLFTSPLFNSTPIYVERAQSPAAHLNISSTHFQYVRVSKGLIIKDIIT